MKKIVVLSVFATVIVVLLATVMMPVIDEALIKTPGHTNDGAQWIRMAYLEDQSDYSISYGISGGDISITNGTDTQTGAVMDTILYADDLATVMVKDGTAILMADSSGTVQAVQLAAPFTVSRTAGVLTVTDNDNDTYSFSDPREWAYIPLSSSNYAVYSAGGLYRDGSALACAGSFAGVNCYNEIISHDVGLQMDADVTADYITSVSWVLEPEAKTLTDKTINPLDIKEKETPEELTPAIKSAPPTPDYTSGDWGYNLDSSNKATIVSYSGATGGVLTIPATIDGYPVIAVGLGAVNKPVVDTESTFTDLIISNGIITINSDAFSNCTGFTGTLTIPDSVTSIKMRAFQRCAGFTGTLTIPDSVTSISSNSFEYCAGFTGLTISDGVTSIGPYAFQWCTGFTGTLTIPDSVTSIRDGAFSKCTGFTGLTISDNVTSIDRSAFSNCTGFTGTLTIPDSVTSIGSSAFQSCAGFTGTLTIPESVISVGTYAFYQCSSFDSLILSDGIESIDTYAFAGGNYANVLIIPSSIATLSDRAFGACDNFTGLVVFSDATPTGEPFAGTTGIKEVLNLGSAEYTTTSYGLAADAVQDQINADAYICAAEIPAEENEGAVYDIMKALPLFVILALFVSVLGAVIYKKLY